LQIEVYTKPSDKDIHSVLTEDHLLTGFARGAIIPEENGTGLP
jgi:hypothetical protein